MYSQSNTETIWAYLWTFMRISSSALIFANYKRTILFQIFSDQDLTFQITKLDSLCMRLHRNNCNVTSILKAMIFLFTISHL